MNLSELGRLQSQLRILQNMTLPAQQVMQMAHSAQAAAELMNMPALEAMRRAESAMCNSARQAAAINKNYEILKNVVKFKIPTTPYLPDGYKSYVLPYSCAAFLEEFPAFKHSNNMVNFYHTQITDSLKLSLKPEIFDIAKKAFSQQLLFKQTIKQSEFNTITETIRQFSQTYKHIWNIPFSQRSTYIESTLEKLSDLPQSERDYMLAGAEAKISELQTELKSTFEFTEKIEKLLLFLFPVLLIKDFDSLTINTIVENLTVIATLYMSYKAHKDSERAHNDAVQAHEDAVHAREEAQFTQRQNQEIINLLKENLEISKELSSKQLPTSQVHHEKIVDNDK